jgi:hypothetical protein
LFDDGILGRAEHGDGRGRLAFLEGRVMEIDGIRDAILHLEQRMDRRIEGLEERMDHRFESVDARFASIDSRFQALETRLDTRFQGIDSRLDGLEATMDARFHSMDDKISRHFVWMVGIQVSSLIAMITAFLVR